MVKKITEQEFENERIGTILVDFYADWCGPCKMVSPIVDELSEDNNDIAFRKVNVDEEANLAIRYNVRSIPTLILFKEGKEVDRVVGFAPKQKLQSWLDSHK
ncbi:MAG TPA: thioredoxin [Acholeplasmataceae bacterium]|jgi:thioredoxin 1|nr:thioredoxin [Acholeplasmataceae bacterium]